MTKLKATNEKRKATHAEFIGTEAIPGYRVTIYTGSKVVASQFFKVAGGYERFEEKIAAAYREAKRYVAGFGVS
jgi:hypothetical protein